MDNAQINLTENFQPLTIALLGILCRFACRDILAGAKTNHGLPRLPLPFKIDLGLDGQPVDRTIGMNDSILRHIPISAIRLQNGRNGPSQAHDVAMIWLSTMSRVTLSLTKP